MVPQDVIEGGREPRPGRRRALVAPTESTKLTLTLAFAGCITDQRPALTLRLRRHGSGAGFVRRLQYVSAWDANGDPVSLEQAVGEITCGRGP